MQVGLVVGGGMLELRVGERRVQTPGLGKLVTGSLYRHLKNNQIKYLNHKIIYLEKSIQISIIGQANDNKLVWTN